jgi:hypothetical protein
MTRFSLPALASVSVLALGLVAAPVSFDLGSDLIGASSAWAKNGGNGNGGQGGGHGGGQGGGHGHGQSGKSGETEVSSTDDVDDVENPEEGEDEEEAKTKTLPDTAIAGKTNSSAFNSANYTGGVGTTSTTGKTPNPNSAVAYSQEATEDPGTTPEDPSGTPEDPNAPEDPNQTPEEPTETPEEPSDPTTL